MVIEAIIIAIGLVVGMSRIANAIDNIAVGIEQHGIQLASVLTEEED